MSPARLRQVLDQVPDPGPGNIDVAATSIVVDAVRRLEADILDSGKAVEISRVGKAERAGKRLCASAGKLPVVVPAKRKQCLGEEIGRERMGPAQDSGVILALWGDQVESAVQGNRLRTVEAVRFLRNVVAM